MESTNKSSSLSGISVALGILVTGLITAFWAKTLLPVNILFSSLLILIGVAGFLIEVEKELGKKNLGIDNAGIGAILLVASFWLIQITNTISYDWLRYSLNIVLILGLILGFSAVSDGVYKILKYVFSKGLTIDSVMKALGLLITLASSVLALLKQANIF